MIIILLVIILTIAFIMFCSSIILLPEGINSDVITKTRLKMCSILSGVLMLGCVFAIHHIETRQENSPENIKAKIEKCMEKYPEFADRCGIAAVR